MTGSATTPRLRRTPPQEGNDSPSPKGWQAKPDGVVPKLRFPEFREAGEWSNALLGKLLIGSPDYGVNAAAVPFADNLPKYLRITDISEGGQYLPDKQVSVDLDATDENYLDDGDIVLARTGASVGKSYRYRKEDGKLVFAGFLIRVKPDPRLLISTYLANFLTTDQFWKWIAVTSARSGQPGVNSTEYSSLAIPLPPKFSEQKKIADCLASLDERITLEAQKLDTLKTHKKGLMQQLFPAEGETLPKLRFPEFREAGEWEEKTLGQVAKYENGKAHEQDIAESGDFVVVNSKFISTEGEVRKFTNTAFCIAEKEDILMVLSDVPNGRAIAKCFFVDSNHLYTVNQRICKLTPYKAVSILLFYVLNRNSYFLAFDDGVKQTNLKIDDVLDCPILLPNSLTEQQKIADCLASLDDLITAQTQKLAALKTHKKGLMQQLFPSVGGVAGEA
jgi:type I restriction enzyme S subunit